MKAAIEKKLKANKSDWRCLNPKELKYLLDHAPMSAGTRQRISDYLDPSMWVLSADPVQQNPGTYRSGDLGKLTGSPLPPGLEVAHGRIRPTSAAGRKMLRGGKKPSKGPCDVCGKHRERIESGVEALAVKRGAALWSPTRGIVCYPCIRRELGCGRCPYCGVGMERSQGLLLCPNCQRGFRDSEAKKNPKAAIPAGSLSSKAKAKALAIYEDFSMQEPKKGWVKNKISLPSPDNPLVWLAVLSECVYISDKEGDRDNVMNGRGEIVDGQHYVHTLKPPYPEILLTADGKTLLIPLEWEDEKGKKRKTSLRIADGWMREHDE